MRSTWRRVVRSRRKIDDEKETSKPRFNTVEAVVRLLTPDNRRLLGLMASVADWPVSGLLVHVAGQGERGFRVIDVWASEDAFRRFGEKLMPILQAVGVEGQPEIYPAHTFVAA
jgi:hypothetical protein